jgi:uncharacterized protein (DUF362 family)/NAD-dependent dihydropyrimidine dehydrogenase PreA subunit
MSSASRPPVSLVRCTSYELDAVEAALRRALEPLGGMGAFVRPGQRVMLKPNLLRPTAPDMAASTHPAVVAAAARLVIEAGGQPLIAESGGGPYSAGVLRFAYRKTEMAWAAEVSGAELNYDSSSVQVSHPDGIVLRLLDVITPLTQADVVINLAKLKTHNLTGLTLAVKNLFGVVPGALKIGYHSKLQPQSRFFEGLVDIYTYVRPALNIMDAIVGMEGNGPSGGDPREIGALLASPDGLALDVASAALVGVDPLRVRTTQAAAHHGLTTGRLEDVELLGDSLEELRVEGFRLGMAATIDPGIVPDRLHGLIKEAEGDGEGGHKGLRGFLYGWLGQQFVPAPVAGDKCTACGFCAKHCPVDAITIEDGRARMDHSKCIRCYCCHELCPQLAVELKRPLLGRVLMRQ